MNAYMFLIVPAIFFLLMALVFNSTIQNSGIATQINRVNCPMPSSSGLWNSSGTLQYSGFTYNYANKSSAVLTLTCTKVHTTGGGVDYNYGQPTVAIGVFFFVDDWLSEGVDKLGAIVALIGLNLTPPSSLPAGVTDLIFYFVYIPMYLMVAVGLYSIFSPFKS